VGVASGLGLSVGVWDGSVVAVAADAATMCRGAVLAASRDHPNMAATTTTTSESSATSGHRRWSHPAIPLSTMSDNPAMPARALAAWARFAFPAVPLRRWVNAMISRRAASTLLGLLVLLPACGSLPPGRPAAQVCAVAPASDAGSALAAASQTFGLSLARQLALAAPANVFTSPLSAQLALAMAAAGARGTTQRAMLDALGLTGLDAQGAALEAGGLTGRLSASGCATVEIANGLWARRGLALDAGFVHTVRTAFGGETATLDGSSAKAINDWVSRRTHGRVPSILDRVPTDVLLELVNATYFHGDWQSAFDAGRTRPGPFHRAAGRDVVVALMDRTGDFAYGAGADYQAVGLPYVGGAERMVVVLPAARLAPPGFASYLDPARFGQITSRLGSASGEVRLPRFGIDVTASLLQPLSALGMGPAFGSGADFSGIARSCQQSCFISDVTQRARLEVDEQGTTAAAATRVGIAVSARLVGEPFQMVVDRPFLVAIQHVPTGTLLFAGVVGDPTG
jgi:serine protease inhibitor